MPRPKRPNPVEGAHGQAREDALLEAAASVFLEHGFAGASTTEIARRARASKQTLYARYPSKEALFMAFLDWQMQRLAEVFGHFLEEALPVRQILINFAYHLHKIAFGREHLALLRFVYLEASRFPDIAKSFSQVGVERGTARLSTFLTAQMKAGVLVADDADIAAELFISLVEGQLLQRALLRLPVSLSETALNARIEKCVDVFLRYYGESSKPSHETPSKRRRSS